MTAKRVLVLEAFEAADPDRAVVDVAVETLQAAGHAVKKLSLAAEFGGFMSEAERAAYHGDEPLVADDTIAAAAEIAKADAMLFCYPTTTFTVPATMKAWLERVLVPGVAFVFDSSGRVRPGMTNIKRLGVITTTPHARSVTRRARDGGRRTVLWTLRLSCGRRCRRSFVSIPMGSADTASTTVDIERALNRW